MIKLLSILALLFLDVSDAVINDLSCTERVGFDDVFSENAVNCENRFPDSSCLLMYSKAVKKGTDWDRNYKCYQNPITLRPDEGLVAMATNNCPKTCGYCCKVANNNNNNNNQKEEDEEPACKDTAPDCKVYLSKCKRSSITNFLKKICKKTCGYCKKKA
ncbi:hypothetical protein Y032_0264g623 [Ancylostoma ceylanicum]|uniref:ShKT domain-containing protein n=1 Tax=Ancylostoma ceylanicum TaxID=53326 RepID=A0A016S9P4_9BILA|nr:hypothetical protein Y032_0264g623 [Ancylostoma ceylanicum]